jgi:hypothetical protein
MKLEVIDNKVCMRPANIAEEATCRALCHGAEYTLVRRSTMNGEKCLRFRATNMLVFDRGEMELTSYNEKTILRPKTRRAEHLCNALMGFGGFAVVERRNIMGSYDYLRFVSTNPVTMNPWIVDGTAPRDITLGDNDVV